MRQLAIQDTGILLWMWPHYRSGWDDSTQELGVKTVCIVDIYKDKDVCKYIKMHILLFV